MVLKIVFLIILILIFTQIYSIATWRIQRSRVRLSKLITVFLPTEKLGEYASELAGSFSTKNGDCRADLKAELESYYTYITSVYKQLNIKASGGEELPAAAQWILDNYYIVEKEIIKIEKNLKTRALCDTAVIDEGEHRGKALVYILAREYAAHHMAQIDYESIEAFLGAYTAHAYLKSDEIRLFFDMLKLVFVRNIAYLCKKIRLSIKEYDYAKKYAQYVLSKSGDKEQMRRRILRYFERGRISNTFVSAILRELRNGSAEGIYAAGIVSEAMECRSRTSYQAVLDEQSMQARYQTDMGGCIRSIIELQNMDMARIFDSVSEVVRILMRDPSQTYETMDTKTKQLYINEVCNIAKKTHTTEEMTARGALQLAQKETNVRLRHIGYYILSDDGIAMLCNALGNSKIRVKGQNVRTMLYICTIWLLALVIGAAAAFALKDVNIYVALSFGFFIMLLATQAISRLVGDVLLRVKKPKVIPKLDLSSRIPPEYATFVITTTLLMDKSNADSLVRNLEDFYLLNRQQNLYFAVLADYKDSRENDFDSQLFSYMSEKIKQLNEKYGFEDDKFYFLLRRRVYSSGEGKWMGAERKRGAICDFVNLLKTGNTGNFINASEKYMTLGVKYVITLDSDTRLYHDSASQMVGAMAHPLNIPIIDEEKNVVTDGYAIMQPHVGIDIESASKTFYTKVYAAYGGLDVYSGASSDVYQDLFGEAIFVGKGIFDVDVFHSVLTGRFPKERVLSHDLLEGSYLRCALLSDVSVSDSYPQKYLSHLSRLHRWVRGDWQLIGWLAKKITRDGIKERNPLNLLSRYKIFDNLRRSILPYVKLRIICASFYLPSPYSYKALAFILVLGAYPVIQELYLAAKLRMSHRVGAKYNANILYGVKRASIEFLLDITTLVYESYVMADAAIRTLYRLFVSKKHLLSWVTAQETEKKDTACSRYHYKKMWISPLFGTGVLLTSIFADAATRPVSALFGLWWIVAPYIISRISMPSYDRNNYLKTENRQLFLQLSRQMWGFFEDFATSEHNYLPPDNVQFEPVQKVAARTSPTNIGLLLASTLCARDFGYISTSQMLTRLENTLDTIDKLEKWQGHLLNWYNTKTLEAMEPKYVSTVDNGNYIADLIMLVQGLGQYRSANNITKRHIQAVLDTARLAMRDDSKLSLDTDALEKLLQSQSINKKECISALEAIVFHKSCIAHSMHEKVCTMAESFVRELPCGNADNERRIDALTQRIQKIIDETSFAPLYDEQRQLFSIGYDIHAEKKNNSYYDLLMSEARQTSYIAVARGEVGYKHWFSLGRNMAMADRHTGLLSWTGTMFEYLMPLLLLKSYRNTIFDESYNFALREQIKYALHFAPVYGISESGYYSFDADLNYAYKAFGVPVLGLKRGLSNERVIAPYASVMSAMLAPNTAAENVKKLASMGVVGRYGLYEAVDFTGRRLINGEDYAIVKSCMVHHIGMSFLALTNLFFNSILQERFLQDSQMRAGSYLLGEKIPICPNISRATSYEEGEKRGRSKQMQLTPCERTYEYAPARERTPAHILSNKNYMLYLDADGCGYAKMAQMYINRPPDVVGTENNGFFIFVSHEDGKRVYPTAFLQNTPPPDSGHVTFYNDKAMYFRSDAKLDTTTSITLCPDENVQLHSVSLTNHSDKEKVLTLTFYTEIILTKKQSDEAHRAFSNLFVSTQYDEKTNQLFAVRAKRFPEEKQLWACLGANTGAELVECVSCETDRVRFLGRNHTVVDADALKNTLPLSGSVGAVLDPIFAMRVKIKLGAMQSTDVNFVLSVGNTKECAYELCSTYGNAQMIQQTFEHAQAYSALFVRYMALKNGEEEKLLHLLPYLQRSGGIKRQYSERIEKNKLGQSGLWRFGISGDNAFVLLDMEERDEGARLNWALKIYRYFNLKGFTLDLAVICGGTHGYTNDMLTHARDRAQAAAVSREGAGRVFAISRTDVTDEEMSLLYTACAFVLDESCMKAQLAFCPSEAACYEHGEALETQTLKKKELMYFNGYGGFDAKNDEYVIVLKNNESTPMPWSNILANEHFGAVVTEAGGGFCFAKNSALNKLTAWTNDALSDGTQEKIYIKDEKSGVVFSPTRSQYNQNKDYIIRHGIGYSVFEHNENALNVKMTVFVPHNEPVKMSVLTIKNTADVQRKLTLTYVMHPVLGSKPTPVPTLASKLHDGVLRVANVYNTEFAGENCFICSSEPIGSYTGSAAGFAQESCGVPAAVMADVLDEKTGAGMEVMLAVSVSVTIAADEEKQLCFALGETESEGVSELAQKCSDMNFVHTSYEDTKRFWQGITGGIKVKTPDEAMDIMLNSHLLYQTVACRLFARSAFYQCGGAYGFRDQLQDVLALMYHNPEFARKQILYHCAHQFEQGDVLHWWHSVKNGNDRGIRTRFSDDLLWLAYVTLEYVRISGDNAIFDEQAPFAEGAELSDGVDEMYYEVGVSEKTVSVYEHILAAVERSLATGTHGLALMGSGDWNDGMSSVGNGGKGESVWLTWFLCDILKKLVPICRMRSDDAHTESFAEKANELAQAANKNAWDGKWYMRAFFDDGSPLGSSVNSECKIDAIAQAWAAISGAGDKEKVKIALESVNDNLVVRENGLIKLLTPAFKDSTPSPGYIQSYVSGVRENGGQYTHGAVWVAMAAAKVGDGERACEYFDMLNPINHTKTPMEAMHYKTEPYAVSADVYTNPAHMGRGGWSFYTGAASWYYKVGIENILGLVREGDKLYVHPCVADDWDCFEVQYSYEGSVYMLHVSRDKMLGKGESRYGSPYDEHGFIQLEKNRGSINATVWFN